VEQYNRSITSLRGEIYEIETTQQSEHKQLLKENSEKDEKIRDLENENNALQRMLSETTRNQENVISEKENIEM